ncbi:hypothetical protein EXIGLDRAFT_718096 [Exidia glandulosa HHB12029]|uniref:Uncharacterized protein n=1 Tax=Exidia glandulosa HHB12029 TaxID=1314781 RepID=A0A166MK95_EXIGL|nr:hypothetical protein EXIGLDRAFT_718096 [Exidia glandulosa HHB12029]
MTAMLTTSRYAVQMILRDGVGSRPLGLSLLPLSLNYTVHQCMDDREWRSATGNRRRTRGVFLFFLRVLPVILPLEGRCAGLLCVEEV